MIFLNKTNVISRDLTEAPWPHQKYSYVKKRDDAFKSLWLKSESYINPLMHNAPDWLLQDFWSVSDYFGTLCIKELKHSS